jgi:hypothetical protein
MRIYTCPCYGPDELWGDIDIDSFTKDEMVDFGANLCQVADRVSFAPQPVIDRVYQEVKEILAKARSGELTAQQAIGRTHYTVMFSAEELEQIRVECEQRGEQIGDFIQKSRTETPN